jgi:3D (Asp-Asp-Asp) domain-containing protein
MNTQTQEALKMAKIFIENSDYKIINLGKGVHVTKDGVIKAIDIALATNKESSLVQPAQEPNQDTLVCASKILLYLGYAQSESMEPSADKRRDKVAEIITNFYTHPHQVVPTSTWQGLTADEKTYYANYSYTSKVNLIDEIEQALKEKNHGL